MRVETDVALAPLTTLGLGGPAKRYARIESVVDLRDALASEPNILVLGGGSNLVVGDAGFDGLVAHIAIRGIAVDCDTVTVAAGESWDDFVAQMVAARRVGIECLSGIPGLVGATPMQNVGAYGQEVSDTITSVRVFDRERGELVALTPAEGGFGYRTSVFRGSARWVIVDVTFCLPRGEESAPIKYAELQRALGAERAPLQAVRDTVIGLRRGKGMVVDPSDPESRSAGSFFTNPLVDAATAARVGGPQWPQPDGRVKLSAGWLIEHAGFAKGYTVGRAGISNKHALALVNRGGATASELLALAREIQDGVRARTGIELSPEPVIVA
jgi:UDP-N-acetylmuramate dehydrogenase